MEQIDIKEKNERLKNLLQMSVISHEMWNNINIDDRMLLEITIEDCDEDEFETLLEKNISRWTGIDNPKDSVYFIVEKRKGSIIYDIIIYTPLGISGYKRKII